MATTYSACCGKLIEKKQAPKCCLCGSVLWTPLWKGETVHAFDLPYGHRDVVYNGRIDGKRLGFIPNHRSHEGKPCCWNGKACETKKARHPVISGG